MQKTRARFVFKSLLLFLPFLPFSLVSLVSLKAFSLTAITGVEVAKTDTSFLDLFFRNT